MTRQPSARRPAAPLLWMSASLITGGAVIVALSAHAYHHVLVLLWICSMLCFAQSAGSVSGAFVRMLSLIRPRHLLYIGVILLPVSVRLLLYTPTRMHGDDILTASFSLAYHPRTTNFFAGIPDKDVWVSSFPTPYFFLQKLFLTATGTTLLAVKLSVIPYVIAVTILLFALGVSLGNVPLAATAVWLYAFFPVSLYLETLGLHFISSTVLFLAFFLALAVAGRKKSPLPYAVAGILCGTSYLSYTSSYIALPVLLIALALRWLKERKAGTLRYAAWSLAGFVLAVAPFVTYAATERNYFADRIGQVSLIGGAWSSYRTSVHTPADAFRIFWENLVVSSRSLVLPGIGGHGGYTYGRQPFFTPVSLGFLIAGMVLAAFAGLRNPAWWLSGTVIVLSFLTGMVLTIPPPAYHRLSLTFPFLALVSALPVSYIVGRKRWPAVGTVILVALLGWYAVDGIRTANRAIRAEALIEDAAVIRYVNTEFPGRRVHIAAFPSFALEKEWLFFPGNTAVSVDTDFHMNYLDEPVPGEGDVYVMTLPDQFGDQFKAWDPMGTLYLLPPKFGVFVSSGKETVKPVD